jgi:hypothetical protein
MTRWLSTVVLGDLLGSGVVGADLNAGRDVAQRLLAESRAAREQAAAAAALSRGGRDLSGLKERTAAL